MIQYAYLTDKGIARSTNEDAMIYRSFSHNPEGFDIETYGSLFTVADGMGGHSAGEIASNMSCQNLLKYYKLPSVTDQTIWEQLTQIYFQINESVLRQSFKIPDFRGMGTTLSTLIIRDKKAWIAHVGDSRIYMIRDRTLTQVTHDHTEVQKMVDQGLFTRQEAEQSSVRNMLTQAIGVDAQLNVFTWSDVIQPDDIYLVCSDGLYDMLSHAQILSIILSNSEHLDKSCNQLLLQARRAGSGDDITMIIIKV